MYNSFLYNESLYNGTYQVSGVLTSSENISFNGYGLQNSSIVTSNLDFEDIQRDFETSAIPNGDGMIANADHWRLKRITMTGILTQTTRALLDTLIDEFKKQVSVQNKNLDIIMGDGTKRRWYCTATTIEVDRSKHYQITFANFRLVFDCLVPFGENTGHSVTDFSVTDLVFSENIENVGNASSAPVWIILVTVATSITKINITNNTTEEQIELTTAVSAGDVIIFDSEREEVLKNGVEVDFDGVFPQLDPGTNSYTITATGTSIEYELTAKTLPKYL